MDEQGQSKAGKITRSTLRAILESARNVQPKDESNEAKSKRLVSSHSDFNSLEFIAKIGIEPARDQYQAKNKLGSVITPDKPEYSGAPRQPAGNGAAQPALGNPQQGGQSNAPVWTR